MTNAYAVLCKYYKKLDIPGPMQFLQYLILGLKRNSLIRTSSKNYIQATYRVLLTRSKKLIKNSEINRKKSGSQTKMKKEVSVTTNFRKKLFGAHQAMTKGMICCLLNWKHI